MAQHLAALQERLVRAELDTGCGSNWFEQWLSVIKLVEGESAALVEMEKLAKRMDAILALTQQQQQQTEVTVTQIGQEAEVPKVEEAVAVEEAAVTEPVEKPVVEAAAVTEPVVEVAAVMEPVVIKPKLTPPPVSKQASARSGGGLASKPPPPKPSGSKLLPPKPASVVKQEEPQPQPAVVAQEEPIAVVVAQEEPQPVAVAQQEPAVIVQEEPVAVAQEEPVAVVVAQEPVAAPSPVAAKPRLTPPKPAAASKLTPPKPSATSKLTPPKPTTATPPPPPSSSNTTATATATPLPPSSSSSTLPAGAKPACAGGGGVSTKMANNLEISQECLDLFTALKLRAKHRYLIFKINAEENALELEARGAKEETLQDFLNKLPYAECRYALVDYEWMKKDQYGTRMTSKAFFVTWTPTPASTQHKMWYTTERKHLLAVFTGVETILATKLDEILIGTGAKSKLDAVDSDEDNAQASEGEWMDD